MSSEWTASGPTAEYLRIPDSYNIALQNPPQGHLQGVAEHDSGYFVTTSQNVNGHPAILHYAKVSRHTVGSAMVGTFDAFTHLPPGERHPGGIQALGNYVAVPVWTEEEKGRIRFYGFSNGKLTECCPYVDVDSKVYSVGITRSSTTTRGFVLAASVDADGKHFVFYRSGPSHDLKSATFQYVGEWKSAAAYKNSISLIQYSGRLLFLGMRTAGIGSVAGWGKDLVCIHTVNAVTPTIEISDAETLHVQATDVSLRVDEKPAPKWGASAYVSNQGIDILFCGYRINRKGGSLQVDLNRFALQHESP